PGRTRRTWAKKVLRAYVVVRPHSPLAPSVRARTRRETSNVSDLLPIELRAELNLPRRVAHRRDAREGSCVVEVQRCGELEGRGVRQVEYLDPEFELLGIGDAELPRESHVDLPERRTGDLGPRSAKRAEVGLPDRRHRRRILERRRVVELIDVVRAGVR